jgi:hypothetical protein
LGFFLAGAAREVRVPASPGRVVSAFTQPLHCPDHIETVVHRLVPVGIIAD